MRELSADLYDQAIRTGRFGELYVGADRARVIAWLDPDQDIGPAWAKRMEGHAFYDYHLQVWFQRSVVTLYCLYFREPAPTVRLTGLTLSTTTKRTELDVWLEANSIVQEEGYFPYLVELPHLQVAYGEDDDVLDSLQFGRSPADR